MGISEYLKLIHELTRPLVVSHGSPRKWEIFNHFQKYKFSLHTVLKSRNARKIISWIIIMCFGDSISNANAFFSEPISRAKSTASYTLSHES